LSSTAPIEIPFHPATRNQSSDSSPEQQDDDLVTPVDDGPITPSDCTLKPVPSGTHHGPIEEEETIFACDIEKDRVENIPDEDSIIMKDKGKRKME
jgi:hypothetical protein